MDKTFSDLTSVVEMNSTDIFAIEQSDGTKQATFEQVCDAIALPDVVEQTAEFPEIAADDSLKVVAGKVNKWQQDALKKIEGYISQEKIISEFPAESSEEMASQVISALLAYTMNAKILSLVADHGELYADYAILKREQMASYGYYGVEWDLDDLMALVQAGSWDKFAVGDYWIETTTSGEQIQYEVAGKNPYLYCGDTQLSANHIVACPRDCLKTTYQYNTSATNAGGYAASLMPDNLETEADKFSSKLQGYMTTIRRLENNKGAWAWASRRIFLPGNVELTGAPGFAYDGYAGGAFNQLQLFVGGNRHILKGAGYNKSVATRSAYWTADPSSAYTTNFCVFGSIGDSASDSASNSRYVAPLIVLS